MLPYSISFFHHDKKELSYHHPDYPDETLVLTNPHYFAETFFLEFEALIPFSKLWLESRSPCYSISEEETTEDSTIEDSSEAVEVEALLASEDDNEETDDNSDEESTTGPLPPTITPFQPMPLTNRPFLESFAASFLFP